MASENVGASSGCIEAIDGEREAKLHSSAIENGTIRDPLDSLVTWVQSLYNASAIGDVEEVSLLQLTQGTILLHVMGTINQKAATAQSLDADRTRNQGATFTRLRNLFTLIQSVQKFYRDVLGQIVVCRLPNCIALAKAVDIIRADPLKQTSDVHGAEGWPIDMQNMLLLLLGCAVQCPQREDFINNIKLLDVRVQHVIVACIRQITDNLSSLWPLEWLDYKRIPELQREGAFAALVNHLQNLVDERDKYLQEAVNAYQNHAVKNGLDGSGEDDDPSADGDKGTEHSTPFHDKPSSVPARLGHLSPEYHHILVDLADTKSKLRRLRQELEEKSELVLELNEEFEISKGTLTKLRAENAVLSQEARAAKLLQDELDIVREKAARVDQLELDVRSYREKMADVEFFKSRVEELREENRVLIETKDLLEDQLESLRNRQEQMMQLEQEMVHSRSQIHQLQMEKEANQLRIEELLEENSKLLLHNRSQADESSYMLVELDRLRHGADANTSLSEELSSDTLCHLRRLELENQRLLSLVDQLKEQHANETNKRVSELEKEKARLVSKVDQLQELSERETTKCITKEAELKEAQSSAVQLKEDIEALRQHHARQIAETEREKGHLGELVEMLRLREEQTKDIRLKQVQEDNKKLLESNHSFKAEISRLQFDRQQLEKLSERLKSSGEKLVDLEDANSRLKVENEELAKTLAAFKAQCVLHGKLEEEHTQLQVEYSKLEKMLDTVKNNVKKFDVIQEEHTALSLQNAQLLRKIENLENLAVNQSAHAQETKETLSWEISQLRAILQATKVERSRYDEMELDLLRIRGENQKLSTLVEASNKRVEVLEKEKQDLEAENESLQRSIDGYKTTIKKMVELERQNAELETFNMKLDKEKSSLSREVAKLKGNAETKDLAYEESSLRINALESENRALSRQTESLSSEIARLSNFEKELGEFKQEKETLDQMMSTLREELVQEKLKNSSLVSQWEQIKTELIRLGVEKSRFKEGQFNARNLKIVCMSDSDVDELISPEESKSLETDEGVFSVRSHSSDFGQMDLNSAQTSPILRRTTLHQSFSSLQQNHAALEVENTTLQAQASSLVAQNLQLQEQNAQLHSEKQQLGAEIEEWKQREKSLIDDHETLQKLHEQLSADYESLKKEQMNLKSSNRILARDFKTLQENFEQASRSQEKLNAMKATLEEEKEILRQDAKALANLRAEHSRLKDDFRSLFAANKRLKEEYKTLQSDHKSLRSDNSVMRLKQTELQGQLDSTQHKISTLELQRSKLAQQCDVLSTLNNTLDEERRHLMTQVSMLLTQYHDLLTQTLQDRNHFHNEEKNYVDKLHDLRRQKEKLEEKIMEQYRRMENVARNRKSFGSALVRRVRKAGSEIMQKVPRASRSRERSKNSFTLHVPSHASDATDSQDSASVASTGGSGSSGDDLLADLCSNDEKSEQFDLSAVSSNLGHRHSMPCLAGSTLSVASASSEHRPRRKTSHSVEAETVLNKLLASAAASAAASGGGGTPAASSSSDAPVTELSLGRVGTRRAVYYSDDREGSKNGADAAGTEHAPSPKVLRGAKVVGKARLPDPGDLAGGQTGSGGAGGSEADRGGGFGGGGGGGGFNPAGASNVPSGARQSPIGMAQSTPEPTSGDEGSCVSGTASPAPDGACATSTPVRPGGVAVKPPLPLSLRHIGRAASNPAKSSLGPLRPPPKPLAKVGGDGASSSPKLPSRAAREKAGDGSGVGGGGGGSDRGGSDGPAGEKKPENSIWYEYGCV